MSIIEIPVGPQHPALKEPIRFIFKIEGEVVVDVEPRLGYAHRGIEKLAETRTFIQNLYLAERVCGICSAAHALCYVDVVEKLLGLEVPERARYIRVIVTELNRIQSHLLWLGVLMLEMGFDTMFMYVWRDRERVLDIIELLCGNRVTYAMMTIGGVRYDITDEMKPKILRMLKYVEDRTKYYIDIVNKDPLIRDRTMEVGILPPREARELCAVGPTIRGSKIPFDIRKTAPYEVYSELDFKVCVHDACDSYARTIVRLEEILEACNIIRQCLEKMPKGPISKPTPRRYPPGEAMAQVEAPRGELMYYVKSDGKPKPYRLKIRTPTLANIPALCAMLKGCYVADIPIIVASIDPCIACMDRVMLVDENKGLIKIMAHEELRRYSLKWYERGRK